MTEAIAPIAPFGWMVAWGQAVSGLAGWRRNGLMALCGIAATLALAPFFAWPLMVPSFSLLFWCAMTAHRPRRAFFDGWWWGFGFFVSGLYWFACALLVDAAHFAWLIPFAVFGLSALFALYTGLAGIFFRHALSLRFWARPIYAATIWTIVEWLRGYLFTGIPWNMTGYVFGASLPTLQASAWLGVTGLTWLTVLLAVTPALWFADARRRSRVVPSLVAALLLALIYVAGAERIAAHPTRYYEGADVRLIQGNVPQKIKSDPAERIRGIEAYARASQSPGKARFVVWSETSMPFPFSSGDEWAQRLMPLVPKDGLLMTGVVRIEGIPAQDVPKNGPPIRIYNSFQALDGQGNVVYRYDKRKLVPFGEFVPFRHILPLEKITPGNLDFSIGTSPGRLSLGNGISLFPSICYEAIFTELSDGAWPSVILNVTNDTWFGRSTGPYQHLAMARMRAVEQGVPLLRDANSGVSAVFDPLGRLLQSLPLETEGMIDTPLPEPLPAPTFYGSYGAQVLVTLLVISTILSLIGLAPSIRS